MSDVIISVGYRVKSNIALVKQGLENQELSTTEAKGFREIFDE